MSLMSLMSASQHQHPLNSAPRGPMRSMACWYFTWSAGAATAASAMVLRPFNNRCPGAWTCPVEESWLMLTGVPSCALWHVECPKRWCLYIRNTIDDGNNCETVETSRHPAILLKFQHGTNPCLRDGTRYIMLYTRYVRSSISSDTATPRSRFSRSSSWCVKPSTL